jgi:predicted regulator of Ras-like GTPase activity (Roadblock/LC7/MglB family)
MSGVSDDPMANSNHASLDWLLSDLVKKLVGVRHAVVLSADGLLVGRAAGLGRDDAEHLAAMASAFHSLARSAGRHFDGGRVRQTVVEMDRVVLFVTAAGRGACLALLANEDANMGVIAYEANMLVKQVGAYLTAAPRNSALPADAAQP